MAIRCPRCKASISDGYFKPGEKPECPNCWADMSAQIKGPEPDIAGVPAISVPLVVAAPAAQPIPPVSASPTVDGPPGVVYPEFARRFAGMFIDKFVFLFTGVLIVMYIHDTFYSDDQLRFGEEGIISMAIILFWLSLYVLPEGLLGGSVGKLMLGMRVVDEKGKQIDFFRALLRGLCRPLSMIMCAGIIYAMLNERYRTFHCEMTYTYVVMKPAKPVEQQNSSANER